MFKSAWYQCSKEKAIEFTKSCCSCLIFGKNII
uniref:Uncharacterized protein n=1 Tax=Arundo donax TaxID=35708 RepID=A0A0A9C120_ARUDO